MQSLILLSPPSSQNASDTGLDILETYVLSRHVLPRLLAQTCFSADVIKTLTCLAKYGEDLMVYASTESLTFSTTNSSMSAYCRFRYRRQFFSRYQLARDDDAQDGEGDTLGPSGQLSAKVRSSLLYHNQAK